MEKKIIMRLFLILLGVFVLVAGVSAGLCVNAYREGSGFEKSDKLINSVKIHWIKFDFRYFKYIIIMSYFDLK